VALMGLLLALVGAFGLAAAPLLSVPTFAATQPVVTCQQQVNDLHCNHQDPLAQGCASTPVTTVSVPILAADGTPLGRLERRHSALCHTWWARIYDYRHLSDTYLVLQVGDFGYTLPYSDMAYCDMAFDTTNTHAPRISGSLTFVSGPVDPSLTVTIPADPPRPTTPSPTPTPKATPQPTHPTRFPPK